MDEEAAAKAMEDLHVQEEKQDVRAGPPAKDSRIGRNMADLARRPSELEQNASDGQMSKSALKKLAAKEAKAQKKAERAGKRGQQAQLITQPPDDDPVKERYGDTGLIQSQTVSGRSWDRIETLDAKSEGKEVMLRCRLQTSRGKGKSAFLVLRQGCATVQAVLFVDDVNVSKTMVKYATQIPKESVLDVGGVVSVPEAAIQSCSQSEVEIAVNSIRCVSRADPLPFELSDAVRPESVTQEEAETGQQFARVNQDTRLDNRFIDLRTPANQAIFRIQSGVCALFRESLMSQKFVEIHTPKLIGGASEGGASVFKLEYMSDYPSLKQSACLAQSPQLYKQMAICADLEKVFEIGPVFRAENSFTHRHLCEFTGLDMEMQINEHYFEVLDVLDNLFVTMFDGLNERFDPELKAVQQQYPFEPLEYLRPTLRLTFEEGIKMLQDAGFDVDPLGDLSTETERELGRLVKEKYKTDFYMLHRYPLAARPFYTMPTADDPRYTCSFDIFIRGEEIISGAQRIHDPELLAERAEACGIDVATIASYIDSFRYGAPPHGGCGVGLERVVMLFLGLNNIRKTSMFPRDPKRLAP